jgi:hypothetical protein
VLALPAPGSSDDRSSGLTGRLVVVAALPADGDRIAAAAATDLLSLAITR